MSSGRFLSNDAVSLYYNVDFPSKECSKAAVVVLVHGLGDHSQSLPYRLVTQVLAEKGFAVFRYDLRGHGNSDGIRGHVDSFAQHREDLGAAIAEARSVTDCSRVYVVASSMGGLIAFDQIIKNPSSVDGLVAIAPALSASGASGVVRTLVPLASKLMPKLRINPGLDLSSISRDAAAVGQYNRDPQFSSRLTLKAASEIMTAVERVNNNLHRFFAPLLILHGSNDKIVPTESSSTVLDLIGTTDKTRILYPDARHNLLIETNRKEVYSDILGWLRRLDS